MTPTERIARVLANPRGRLAAFFGLGVLDGSILPVPLEPFVLPVLAAHPRRAPLTALALLAGCLTGCLIFYAIGRVAGEALVDPLLQRLGLLAAFEAQLDPIRENAFATLFVIGLTPIPLHIGTLGAGVTGVGPGTLLAALLLSRGLRYAVVTALAVLIGLGAEDWFRRNRGRMLLIWVGMAAVGVVLLRLLGI